MQSRVLALATAVLVGGVPAWAVDSGGARGIVTVAGTPAALTHSMSRLEKKGGAMQTVIVMSNVRLSRAEAADGAKLAARAKAGELVAVEVFIDDESGIARPQVVYAKAVGGKLVSDVQATWNSSEFTDKIAEGQLASDGTLETGTKKEWSYDVDFRSILPGHPSADLEYGVVQGTAKIGGKPVTLQHALAWVVNDEIGEGTGTRVVVSDRKIDLDTARDEAALWTKAEAGELSAIRILIDDETGTVESQTFFAKWLPTRLSTGTGSTWSKWEFTDDVIRGGLSSDGPQELLELTWEYDLNIASKIE